MTAPAPVRVNRAPVLTLWAAIVAERLGHGAETALSLASAVAGTAARAKARRLGIAEEAEGPASPARGTRIRLLGREIAVVDAPDGTPRAAEAGGAPADAAPVRRYLERAFGPRLDEVRAAMQALAAAHDPDELNRIGFRLYEAFRPEVPEGVTGWGAKGELRLERIAAAAA